MEEMLWHKHKWPAQVPKTLNYPEEPLFDLLDKIAEKSGELTYTIFEGATCTHGETQESADRIANFLVNQGIKKGDRVAIFLPNTPHYPPIFFGILKAGATAVTCNPLYSTRKTHKIYKKVEKGALWFAGSTSPSGEDGATGEDASFPRKGLLVKDASCLHEGVRPVALPLMKSGVSRSLRGFVNDWSYKPFCSGYLRVRSGRINQ